MSTPIVKVEGLANSKRSKRAHGNGSAWGNKSYHGIKSCHRVGMKTPGYRIHNPWGYDRRRDLNINAIILKEQIMRIKNIFKDQAITLEEQIKMIKSTIKDINLPHIK